MIDQKYQVPKSLFFQQSLSSEEMLLRYVPLDKRAQGNLGVFIRAFSMWTMWNEGYPIHIVGESITNWISMYIYIYTYALYPIHIVGEYMTNWISIVHTYIMRLVHCRLYPYSSERM